MSEYIHTHAAASKAIFTHCHYNHYYIFLFILLVKDSCECNIEGTVHPDRRRVKGDPALEPGLRALAHCSQLGAAWRRDMGPRSCNPTTFIFINLNTYMWRQNRQSCLSHSCSRTSMCKLKLVKYSPVSDFWLFWTLTHQVWDELSLWQKTIMALWSWSLCLNVSTDI